MKKIVYLVAVFMLLLCSGVFAQEANVVQNPGFEDGTETTDFWNTKVWDEKAGTEFKWEASENHTGAKCAEIISNVPNHARYMQEISVKPGTIYKISGWIKSEDVGANGKGANLSIEELFDTSKDIKGNNGDWEYVELYGRTGSDQKSFILTLDLGGYGSLNTGKAFFDDIVVEETPDLPQGSSMVNLFKQEAGGQAATTTGSSKTPGYIWIAMGIAALLLIAFLIAFLSRGTKKPLNDNSETQDDIIEEKKTPLIFKIDKKDIIIMSVMTLIYLIITTFNLGSLDVPQTAWKPTQVGESFVVDLGREYDISRISYYDAYGEGKFRIQYLTQDGKFASLATIDKKPGDFYLWKYSVASVKTKQFKVIVDTPGGVLNELGIFEKGSQKPISLTSANIIDKKVGNDDTKSIENLFDEQQMVQYTPSYMTGTYFDEIYHARTAFEHLHLMPFYENTHPPLGKLIISIGIAIFGMNPFGWRIMGALFGAAMIPLMYLFGKKMFMKRLYAFMAAFLIMFDFMHFSQTRIATIDTYGVFFVILMYYFMYDSFMKKSYTIEYRHSLKPLLLSGIFFGIGAASKWIGLYAGAGLAFLYFLSRYLEYRDYERVKNGWKKGPARKFISSPDTNEVVPSKKWANTFIKKNLIQTSLYCILFFIVIPVILYTASYIPIMMTPGNDHGLQDVWNYQTTMYNYHSTLKDTHVYQSPAWSWPFITRPLCFYWGDANDLPAGKVSTMTTMGNPAIWWFGIIALLASLAIAIRKKDKKMVVVFAAMTFQYLPWFLVQRCIFIYHFFSSVPFLILCIVYLWKFILEDSSGIAQKLFAGAQTNLVVGKFARYSLYIYLLLVAALFIWFYPALSGMIVDKSYVDRLRWFPNNWVF